MFPLRLQVCIGCLFLLVFEGCDQSPKWNNHTYKSAVKSGRLKISAATEMEARFHNTEHFLIEYYQGKKENEFEWQTVSFFEGKYVLTMVANVQLTPDGSSVQRITDEIKFHLWVVRTCTNNGGCSYDTTRSRNFGSDEWKRFVASENDFRILDLKYDGVHVEYFDTLAEMEQAPRRIWR